MYFVEMYLLELLCEWYFNEYTKSGAKNVITGLIWIDDPSVLTLVLLNPDIPYFANSVNPDQLASEEAN